MNEKSLSDRILGYSLAVSVVVNLAWIAVVSRSDIFGAAASFTQLHEKKIKVFKPIPQKPKPKKELPPPPPPKPPKVPPKIQPLKHLKPLPPRPAPRPRPPAPTRTVQVARTTRTTPNQIALPAAPENTGPIAPVVPTYTPSPPVQAPPVQAPPVQAPPVQAPPVQAPPVQAPPVVPKHVDVVKPPPVVHHPDNWVPIDMQQASVPEGLAGEISTEGIEPGSTDSDSVVISFIVDENGHTKNQRFKKRSGNSELDERVMEAVKRVKCVPAVQDHIPREAPGTFVYSINNG